MCSKRNTRFGPVTAVKLGCFGVEIMVFDVFKTNWLRRFSSCWTSPILSLVMFLTHMFWTTHNNWVSSFVLQYQMKHNHKLACLIPSMRIQHVNLLSLYYTTHPTPHIYPIPLVKHPKGFNVWTSTHFYLFATNQVRRWNRPNRLKCILRTSKVFF